MENRHIVHFSFPDFYATLEERRHPELKKKPLALAVPGPRSVIQGVNALARREGIQEGMAFHHAKRFCRRLTVFPVDLPAYMEEHQQILIHLGRFSPLVEGPRPGRYFVDLTGTHRLWGAAPDVSFRMEKELAAQRTLHARVGLAGNKLVSQVASRCIIPGELSCIFAGGEVSFLTPLPLDFLPGVGPATLARLRDFNLRSIGQLAHLPSKSLASVLGKTGIRLAQMARGVDLAPVLPFVRSPGLSIVQKLDRDEIHRENLEGLLFQQVEEAGWHLRRHNRCPGRFTLEVRYADGGTARLQQPLPPITTRVDQQLFRKIRPVFLKFLQRRVAIRRIGLELGEFSMPARQLPLFPWEEETSAGAGRIQQALDAVRTRFGRESIAWGRVVQMEAKGSITVEFN